MYGINTLRLIFPGGTWSSLVQVWPVNCFGAQLLPEPMLANCQLEPWEQN